VRVGHPSDLILVISSSFLFLLLISQFLRLVFHDCIGGCDGCVDSTNPENAGLGKPIDILQPIADEFEPQGLSRTDIWMLSSLVATELALPFENNDLLYPLHWIGRQTCESRFANVTDQTTGHCGNDWRQSNEMLIDAWTTRSSTAWHIGYEIDYGIL